MRPRLIAALCAILCAGPTAAFAQEDDDWEFEHVESGRQTVAVVRYDAGVAIVVQCREGALSAALVGMPAGVGGIEVQARRADGRTDTQTWAPGPAPGILLSTVPARDIRFMRGGGLYSVRTVEGAPRALRSNFDLPTQSASLDRVLTACGWALTDERDQIARAPDTISFRDPDARLPRMPTRRGATTRAQRQEIVLPPPPPPAPAEQQASCIIRDMRATECRRVHPAVPVVPAEVRAVERLNGQQVYGADPATAEGRVLYTSRAWTGTTTVIDYIATVPAR